MRKVYLILRNNKQSGPHSLEELLESGLKPDDLIWIEGKSFSWSFPSEIDTLKNHLPVEQTRVSSSHTRPVDNVTDKPTNLRKVFVSLPDSKEKEIPQTRFSEPANNDLERKADELRKRAESYLQQKTVTVDEEVFDTKYTRSLNDVEEEYTSWVYNKVSKKKKVNIKPFLLFGSAIIIAIAFFVIRPFSVNGNISTASPIESPKPEIVDDVTRSSEVDNLSTDDTPPMEESIELKRNVATAVNNASGIKENIIKEKPSTTLEKPGVMTKMPTGSADDMDKSENDDRITVKETLPATADISSTEQKKTLKEKIGGFFEKIKDKKSGVKENEDDLKGATSPSAGSGRKATKRGEGAAASVETDLSSYAHVTTNQTSGNWMMGVRGMKVVVRNNGNHPIKTAVVEVNYYNDQNELLEKKLLQFSNIAAKKSGTQSAPDHRLADHADIRLVSATGNISDAKE